MMDLFSENSQPIKAGSHFYKKLHHRRLNTSTYASQAKNKEIPLVKAKNNPILTHF